MLLLYNLLLLLAMPAWVPWMLWRAKRRKEPVDWAERLGRYPFSLPRSPRRVWLHAVSVGEVMASLPVLRELARADPPVEVVLSTTTSSGRETALKSADGLFCRIVYFPVDIPRFCLRALASVKPSAVVVMETEVWPNFFFVARQMGIELMLANARLSDRSYAKKGWLRLLYRPALGNVALVMAQSEEDARRLRDVGARECAVLGNTKFDQAASAIQPDGTDWRAELGLPAGQPVVVVGSTRSETEERLVAQALADPRLPPLSVVWAPRHVERGPAVARALQDAGREPAFRSEGGQGATVVLDTYGELGRVYAAADVVVVGGGFDDLGGQDIIQPMAHGKPVVHGPHMHNFRDVARLAAEAGAAVSCEASPQALAAVLARLLADEQARARMGEAGRSLVQSHRGAGGRIAREVLARLG